MSNSNYVHNVAIVGAGGNIGSRMVDALLTNGKHTVTAITRTGSTAEFPKSVVSRQVDYNKPETLIKALQGQDALIITLSGYAPQDTELKLVKAAGEAGVKWILPSEWGPDTANQALVDDVFVFKPKGTNAKLSRKEQTLTLQATSDYTQRYLGDRQELLHSNGDRLLVRVHHGNAAIVRDRLQEPLCLLLR